MVREGYANPAFKFGEKEDAFGGVFKFGQPSSCCCDVIGLHMQPLKGAAAEFGHSYHNGDCFFFFFDSGRTNDDEVRIVIMGKTGTGKSATGNTILGCECFESRFNAMSMTEECLKGKVKVDGHRVAVIDTPGLFDTRFDKKRTTKNICQCISYASPGPHIFLVVVRLGRYTEEEKQTVQKIQKVFGTDADKYSMVLFTHGDQLEGTTMEEFLEGSSDLQELVARCNGQYHVFNNKLKERSQVTELIQKIREIVQKNGGSHYTNEMFQEAERAIEEDKLRILREKEEEIRETMEKMEKEIQERYEKQMQKYNEQLQAERERERKEREKERKRERKREEKEWEMKKLKEKCEREVEEERRKIQSWCENEARDEAEEFNPLYHLIRISEVVADAGRRIFEEIKQLEQAIFSLFK